MKRKTISIAALILTLSLFLTGCYGGSMVTQLTLKNDNTCTGKMTMYCEKESFDAYVNRMKNRGEVVGNVEEIRKHTTNYKGTVCYVLTSSFQKYADDVCETLGFEEIYPCDYAFNKNTVYLAGEGASDVMKVAQSHNNKFKCTFEIEITFPNKIIETNGVIDENNPNKVKFITDSDNGYREIFATTVHVDKETLKQIWLLNQVPEVGIIGYIRLPKPQVVKRYKKSLIIKWRKKTELKKYQVWYRYKYKRKKKTKWSKWKGKVTTKNKITLKKLKRKTKYYVYIAPHTYTDNYLNKIIKDYQNGEEVILYEPSKVIKAKTK